MNVSTTFRTAMAAVAISAAGVASAATTFTGTGGTPQVGVAMTPSGWTEGAAPTGTVGGLLGISGPANVKYTVTSKAAAYTNVFLVIDGVETALSVGESFTVWNLMDAGALNFGFKTTDPTTAAFSGGVLNGSGQIIWNIVGSTLAYIGFEDLKIPGGDKDFNDLVVTAEISAVPLPGAALLFGTALLTGAAARRKKQASAVSGKELAA